MSQSVNLIFFKNLFFLNILLTKTNSVCSITTYKDGKVILIKTPRMFGVRHTKKRTEASLRYLLQESVNKFFSKYSRNKSRFILQFSGSKLHLLKKTMRYLMHTLRLGKNLLFLKLKHSFPHNGCRLQNRKRRKNKGKNKWKKRRVRLK